ncbi:hypothetical protein S245_010334 [Arachis hypogaea]
MFIKLNRTEDIDFATMETENELEPKEGLTIMLPPPPGTFQDREDLIKHMRDFGANEGYVVTIKKPKAGIYDDFLMPTDVYLFLPVKLFFFVG